MMRPGGMSGRMLMLWTAFYVFFVSVSVSAFAFVFVIVFVLIIAALRVIVRRHRFVRLRPVNVVGDDDTEWCTSFSALSLLLLYCTYCIFIPHTPHASSGSRSF